jgi:glycosyltransferase involved in cell wall biosynthesis
VKLLIVSQYFWPEDFRINDLAVGLAKRGHEVTVLTGKPNYPEGRFHATYGFFRHARDAYQGVNVVRVPLIPRGRGGRIRLALNYASFSLFASLLGPFRCGARYDAILVYEPSPITVGLPALVMKKRTGAPIFFWVQDLWPESLSATGAVRSRALLNLVERFVRFVYRGCDRILVQSLAFSEPIQRLGVEKDRILYFPNSAEDFYGPVEADRVPEGVALPTGFRIMFAGNIGAAQALDTVLAAAERLRSQPDIHWIILGDGRLAPWVRDEIGRRKLEHCVHLLGRHPAESMPHWFALADAMLVTLKREPIFALTIPSKVQSYLACAKPIVAALDGEGGRIVRESGAGIAVAAEDPDALAQSVLRMYEMPEAERREMGLRGRRYFEAHFERRMLLERLEQWILNLTRQPERCAS